MEKRSRVGNALWKSIGSLGGGMDGDARDTTHCLWHEHRFSVSQSLIFIKDLSHFSPSTFVSAFQISFIIVGLMCIMFFVIAVHGCSVASLLLCVYQYL